MKTIRIKFTTTEKIYDFVVEEKNELVVLDDVLVDSSQIMEVGQVVKIVDRDIKSSGFEKGTGNILRKLSQDDRKKIIKLKKIASEFLPICQEKLIEHDLPGMKILNADLSYDGKKLTIYFGAEGRIDFRDLVTDLARTFKKIIRLQQIGARDEAKIFGGYGPCGREICCKKHLKNIESITLDMAKKQNLLTSASKISGICGKLMCCLAYEKDLYRENKQITENTKLEASKSKTEKISND